MRLITAHRILIAAAIAFFAFYAVVELRAFARTGGTGAVLQAAGSGVVVIGLVLYYRTLSRWGQPR